MPSLNQHQFTQLELPGMPDAQEPHAPEVAQGPPGTRFNPGERIPPPRARAGVGSGGYTSAHDMGGEEPNPIYPGAVARKLEPTPRGKSGPEFIPPWRAMSNQKSVNREAIEHQKQHANPLALNSDPFVIAHQGTEGEEVYDVRDGNHRINAAQERGQLLMPANVYRVGG